MASNVGSRATIYQITNLVNGKFYIGITRFSTKKRWREHLTNAELGRRTRLSAAIRKYGAENFALTPVATVLSIEDWSAQERAVIYDRRPPYNQTNGGEITRGRRVPPEIIAKIRAANLGKKRSAAQNEAQSLLKKRMYQERPDYRAKVLAALEKGRQNQTAASREKQGATWRGRKHKAESIAKMRANVFSAVHRANISAALKGRVFSEEWREKMSRSAILRHARERAAREVTQ